MGDYELDVREIGADGVRVVALAGDLDLTNADALERELRELAEGGSGIVLDLDRVTFVDSAALHALFRLGRALYDTGKGYAIALAPTARVASTVQMARLDEAVTVAATAEDALAGISS
jgi:anti-anti-sigma factor